MFVHLNFFYFLSNIFEMKQLAGYFRPYFCLLRACWPCCPSASTSWTCTTVLPTLRRRLVKRLDWRGRTFLTSSMSCWVSHDEISMSAASGSLVLSHCVTTDVIYEIYLSFFIHGMPCNYSCICMIAGRNLSQWRTISVFFLQDLFLPSMNRMPGADFICCFQSCVLIHDWMKERFQFRGHFQSLASAVCSRSSFLVWIWLIKHTLWKSKSLYSAFTRLHCGVSPSLRSGEQIFMNCSLAWSLFWASECHTMSQAVSADILMVKNEPVERGGTWTLTSAPSIPHLLLFLTWNVLLYASASAALIRGNRTNCTQFSHKLDWLVSKLERLESSSGIKPV